MSPEPFTIRRRIRSFRDAFRGLWTMLRSQHNAWIHALATGVAVAAGIVAGLSPLQWCAIVLAIGAVWTAEALNTALELLADAASPEPHPLVGKAKDVAAGAVLITALGAVIVALLVFGPRWIGWP
jgi:diacylglycerol kinase (ATP)